MNRSAIPVSLRLANCQRARGCCEYCLVHEDDSLIPHQPDHIIAVQHRGPTTIENLALACCDCNLAKGPNLSSVDPESGRLVPLFHPRQDRWAEHFRLEAGHIMGTTATGRATTLLLQLNAPDRIRQRQQLQRARRISV